MKKRISLIHPDLSYKLVGLAYNIHNKIGGGLREKSYEEALAKIMDKEGIKYKRQLNVPVKYLGVKVANRFLNFLVNDEIVVELKSGGRLLTAGIEQIHEYLKYQVFDWEL